MAIHIHVHRSARPIEASTSTRTGDCKCGGTKKTGDAVELSCEKCGKQFSGAHAGVACPKCGSDDTLMKTKYTRF